MGFDNLVQMESLAYLNAKRACLNLLGKVIERRPHKVFRLAGVDCQANPCGDYVHWRELIEGPLVSDDAGHADDAAPFWATERVFECRRANHLEYLVDASGI